MRLSVRATRQYLVSRGVYNCSVTIGADPEYEFVNGGNVVSADTYVPSEDTSIGNILHHTHRIGVDGSGQQIELRPDYAHTPHEFIVNMRSLFDRLRQYKMLSSGDTYALGGHIHFGCGGAYEPSDKLMACLDYYLGKRSLELCGEARGGYARLGAWEIKDWGFEYRTPPAAIFHHPTTTRLHLKIAKGVCDRFFSRGIMDINLDAQCEWEELGLFLNALEIIQLKGFYNKYMENMYHDNVIACWVKPLPTVAFELGHMEDEDEDRPPQPRGLRERDFVGWIGPGHQTSLTVHEGWGDMMFNEIRRDAHEVFSPILPNIPIVCYGLRRQRGEQTVTFFMNGVDNAEWASIHDDLRLYFDGWGFNLVPWPQDPMPLPTLWIGFSRPMRDDNGAHYHDFIASIAEMDEGILDDINDLYDRAVCRQEQLLAIRNVVYDSITRYHDV